MVETSPARHGGLGELVRPRVPGRHLRRGLAGLVLPLTLLSLTACGEEGDDAVAEPTSGDPVAATEPVDQTVSDKDKKDDGEHDGADDDSTDDDSEDEDDDWAPGAVGERVPPGQLSRLLKAGVEATTTAHVTMTSTGGIAQFSGEGDVDYTTDPPSTAMTMTVGSEGTATEQIEVRRVDGTAYIKLPGAGGGKFLAFDLKNKNSPLGPDFVAQSDPTRQIDVLTRGMRKIVYKGSEDGLDRYQVLVSGKQVAQTLGTGGGAGLSETLTYDLWLDDRQRLRRMTIDMGGPLGGFEMRLDDFGDEVDIRKPAPGQIMQAPAGGGR